MRRRPDEQFTTRNLQFSTKKAMQHIPASTIDFVVIRLNAYAKISLFRIYLMWLIIASQQWDSFTNANEKDGDSRSGYLNDELKERALLCSSIMPATETNRRRILIPTENFDQATFVLRWYREFIHHQGDQLYFLHMVQAKQQLPENATEDDVRRHTRRAYKSALRLHKLGNDLKKIADCLSASAKFFVHFGRISGERICKIAVTSNVDLVLLGTKRDSTATAETTSTALIVGPGDISAHVANFCLVPVIMVPKFASRPLNKTSQSMIGQDSEPSMIEE